MRRALSLVLLLIAFVCAGGARASDSSSRVNFLVNFSQFTEWPEPAVSGAPITFCLAPGDPQMAVEFAALERQTVRNRPVRALQVGRPAEVAHCQVLFLPADLPGDPARWLSIAERDNALTISDRPDFINQGGIIGLALVAGRYRFDVNLATAKRVNLYLAANLLKLARLVK